MVSVAVSRLRSENDVFTDSLLLTPGAFTQISDHSMNLGQRGKGMVALRFATEENPGASFYIYSFDMHGLSTTAKRRNTPRVHCTKDRN